MKPNMEQIRQKLKAQRAVGMNMEELKVWLADSNLDIGFELKGSANVLIGKILDAMKEGKVKFRAEVKPAKVMQEGYCSQEEFDD